MAVGNLVYSFEITVGISFTLASFQQLVEFNFFLYRKLTFTNIKEVRNYYIKPYPGKEIWVNLNYLDSSPVGMKLRLLAA